MYAFHAVFVLSLVYLVYVKGPFRDRHCNFADALTAVCGIASCHRLAQIFKKQKNAFPHLNEFPEGKHQQ